MPVFNVKCPYCGTPRKVGANNLVKCLNSNCGAHYSVGSDGNIKSSRPGKK